MVKIALRAWAVLIPSLSLLRHWFSPLFFTTAAAVAVYLIHVEIAVLLVLCVAVDESKRTAKEK